MSKTPLAPLLNSIPERYIVQLFHICDRRKPPSIPLWFLSPKICKWAPPPLSKKFPQYGIIFASSSDRFRRLILTINEFLAVRDAFLYKLFYQVWTTWAPKNVLLVRWKSEKLSTCRLYPSASGLDNNSPHSHNPFCNIAIIQLILIEIRNEENEGTAETKSKKWRHLCWYFISIRILQNCKYRFDLSRNNQIRRIFVFHLIMNISFSQGCADPGKSYGSRSGSFWENFYGSGSETDPTNFQKLL